MEFAGASGRNPTIGRLAQLAILTPAGEHQRPSEERSLGPPWKKPIASFRPFRAALGEKAQEANIKISASVCDVRASGRVHSSMVTRGGERLC